MKSLRRNKPPPKEDEVIKDLAKVIAFKIRCAYEDAPEADENQKTAARLYSLISASFAAERLAAILKAKIERESPEGISISAGGNGRVSAGLSCDFEKLLGAGKYRLLLEQQK